MAQTNQNTDDQTQTSKTAAFVEKKPSLIQQSLIYYHRHSSSQKTPVNFFYILGAIVHSMPFLSKLRPQVKLSLQTQQDLHNYNLMLIGFARVGRLQFVMNCLSKDKPKDINITDRNGHSLLWHATQYYIENIHFNKQADPKDKEYYLYSLKNLCSRYGANPGTADNPDSPRALVNRYSSLPTDFFEKAKLTSHVKNFYMNVLNHTRA